MAQIHNRPALKPLRKALRSSLTPAEALLWKNLQQSRLDGRKFRRQHSVGPYVLDFYCPACRLAVELDGAGHFDSIRSEYDARRTEYLNNLGIRVVRFENRRIFEDLESVLEAIRRSLQPGKVEARNSPYSIRVPKDSKKDREIVVAAFLSFLLLFSFFPGPVHSVEIRATDDSESRRLV